jgi:hypothetical protein
MRKEALNGAALTDIANTLYGLIKLPLWKQIGYHLIGTDGFNGSAF